MTSISESMTWRRNAMMTFDSGWGDFLGGVPGHVVAHPCTHITLRVFQVCLSSPMGRSSPGIGLLGNNGPNFSKSVVCIETESREVFFLCEFLRFAAADTIRNPLPSQTASFGSQSLLPQVRSLALSLHFL
ncbi:hypothetical protein ACFX13_025549 [Malus domestica]